MVTEECYLGTNHYSTQEVERWITPSIKQAPHQGESQIKQDQKNVLSIMPAHNQWWKKSFHRWYDFMSVQSALTASQHCFSLLLETVQDGSQKATDTAFYRLKCYWKWYWNRTFPHSYSIFWQLKGDYVFSLSFFFFPPTFMLVFIETRVYPFFC